MINNNRELKDKPSENIAFDYGEKILGNFYIVLARPKLSRNVGSVARAMLNMGLTNLIISGSKDIITKDAYALARSAGSLLDNALFAENLKEALEDMNYIVGTTRRPTKYNYEISTPCKLIPSLVELAGSNKIAVVFGPEDAGLSTEDLSLCNSLLRIPTSDKYPSINLSQAVLLVCSEVFKNISGYKFIEKKAKEKPHSKVVEGLFEHLEEFLREIDYFQHNCDIHTMHLFRQIFRSCELDNYDIGLLRSVLHKTQYYIKHRRD